MYLCIVIPQGLHVFQEAVLGLGVLQQCTDVEHVVEVSLDLHLQLVALCVLQFLSEGRPQVYIHKRASAGTCGACGRHQQNAQNLNQNLPPGTGLAHVV